MTSKLFRVAVACALLATARAGSAEDFKAGDIVISHPWSRATPTGAQVGAGYLVIENRGSLPDRFLGGSVEAATGFELHDVVLEGGIRKMRQLTGIELPPGVPLKQSRADFTSCSWASCIRWLRKRRFEVPCSSSTLVESRLSSR